MKSIQNQYRDLKEGRMSQANFMRNLRMNMPQYVTNVTSFNDAVRILKNKAILNEAALGENNLLDELESEMENGNSYAEAIAKVAAKYNIDEDTLATKYPEEAVGDKAYADDFPYPDDASDDEYPRDYDTFSDYNDGEFWEGKENNDEDDELEAMIKKMEQEKEGEEAIMSQFDPMEEELNEKSYKVSPNAISVSSLKKGDVLGGSGLEVVSISAGARTPSGKIEVTVKDPKTGNEVTKVWNKATKVTVKKDLKEAKKKKEDKAELHPNQINPSELRMGIKVELEHTDDLDKAKKIALDHLAENPFYYTALKLAGIESPSAPKIKAPVEKKAKKKKEAIEMVDTANQMQKVKMPKAEDKKKLKETVEERMMFQDEPADPEKYQIKKDLKGKIVQVTNDDGNVFSMNDEAIAIDNGEKIKIAGFKEEQGKVKAIFSSSTGMFFSSIDIDGLEPINRGVKPGVDLGKSFEKFKSQLEEIVREVLTEMESDEQEIDDIAMAMDEYFDGRDDLINPLAALEK